tara:strand:+ start:1705 stop:2250 length:546 start_codon:yes stop_codon:yes gene_type:complete
MIDLVQEDEVKYEHLDRVVAMLSYDEYSLRQQFPYSVFDDAALAKVRECLGFLYGVALQDKALADRQAGCLFRYLNRSTSNGVRWRFFDDRSPFSFGFSMYAPIAVDEVQKHNQKRTYDEDIYRLLGEPKYPHGEIEAEVDGKVCYFRYSMNGGLIYHGPRTWENWTVRIGGGDQWWSSHT